MPNEWPTVRIEDIAEKIAMGPFGSNIKVETFVETGVPVISGAHLRGVRLEDSDFNFVTDEHAERMKNSNVFRGDVIFTHAGNIGQVAYIPPNSQYERYVISQRQFYLRCDLSKAAPAFISYFFRSNEGQHKLLANASQTGVPSIARPSSYLKTIELSLPPLTEQRAIVHILGTLDDKIELNRKQNETLEAMARALFKAWFVDFEPVRAKLEGRWQRGQSLPGLPADLFDLLPDRLIESELGEIPEGWEHIPFGSLLESTIGGDWGKDTPEDDHSEVVSIIRGTDFPDVSSGGIGKVPTRYTTAKKLASRQLQAGDIVLEISGGSPTQPTGRSIFISEAILERFGNAVVCASFCRRFQPKSRDLGVLAFMHLQHLYAAGGTWEYQNQSTGIANFQTTRFLESEMVVVPSAVLLRVFVAQANSLLKKMSSNENLELVKLRETLLPKLISGELRIQDAEEFLKRANA